jgi:hypothetical protein
MANDMPLYVEVWPVSVDDSGIWLISGDMALVSGPVQSDRGVHAEVELVLLDLVPLSGVRFLHSTSWREQGQHALLTYFAAIDPPAGLDVRGHWRNARPVSEELAVYAGPAGPGPSTTPPEPRPIDVLLHGLRHLRFLLDTDDGVVATMDERWRRHLTRLTPALAGMYRDDHQPVTIRDPDLH